jgi:hypothetical protein
MARRRDLKGVLRNFLDTHVSRYSDFDGYWLFGLLMHDVGDLLEIDLVSNRRHYQLRPVVRAVSDLGRMFEATKSICVATHDPARKLRRGLEHRLYPRGLRESDQTT